MRTEPVKRYSMIHNLATPEHLVSSMQEWSVGPLSGEWVKYEDYSKLEAEVERLTERNKFLEQIDSYLQDANEHSFEQRCNELEAEVERLKGIILAQSSQFVSNAMKSQDIKDHPLMGPAGAERGWWGVVPPPEEGKQS